MSSPPRVLPTAALPGSAVWPCGPSTGRSRCLPSPALVSPADSGSHGDMDFRTFLRSLQSLRGYFPEITRLGATAPDFEALRRLGVAAEAKMLAATGGINTHRGAIFNIGLLCAAAGALAAEGGHVSVEAVCAAVTQRWADAILGAANPAARSPWGGGHSSLRLRGRPAGSRRRISGSAGDRPAGLSCSA
jgi:triphosphoribosyl-dephospho-CoA synthase